jgi:hypothetical protein
VLPVPVVDVLVVLLVDAHPEGLARDGELLLGHAPLEAEGSVRAESIVAADAAIAVQAAVANPKIIVLKKREKVHHVSVSDVEDIEYGTGRQVMGKRSVADPDPGSGAFLLQGSGIRDDFFSGSRILTTSQIQDFTFKNGEKQEKLNFI